jgi:enoyl-CoA hydratase/carnithine racemase
VVTGAGRGFCAGADIGAEFQAQIDKDLPSTTDENPDAPANSRKVWDWVGLIRDSKPMVAAVNGPAIGMGLSMILPFDRIMAGPTARLSARFIKVGVVPELASSHFLPHRVGFGAASDLMLSGRIVDAEEALGMGLVDELVDDDLVPAAIARARTYAENAPPHLRWVKQLLTENLSESSLAAVQRRELDALRQAYETPEHHEAVAAFLEKRTPNFRRVAP